MKTLRQFFLCCVVLLIVPLFSGIQLKAQDTIPKVIISEFRNAHNFRNYAELTNVGDTAVNLKDFFFGSLIYYRPAYTKFNITSETRLPDYILKPDSSYLIAVLMDYAENNWVPDPIIHLNENFSPRAYWKYTDLPVFISETNAISDSISIYRNLLTSTRGGGGFYLKYQFPDSAIAVIDAVKNDIQADGKITSNAADIAGVYLATKNHHMVRKANIIKGNLNWDESRGIDAEDSEWLVFPFKRDESNPYQKDFTTLKHHGVAEINASAFSSESINIDLDNQTLSVPWGIYRDSLMFEFELGRGLAWRFRQSPVFEDSLYRSLRTGDTLRMMAVGNTLQEIDFAITVSESSNANHVLPTNKHVMNSDGESFYIRIFSITEELSVMDSITSVPFGLRVDTLFKYIEKASIAEWEIVWVDGAERPDLKRGDILKVTAENGDVKEYFIAADSIPEPSHNAYLSAITWPDVPGITMVSPEWGGETVIPKYNRSVFSYFMKVPYTYKQIPALKAIPEDLNAQISVDRATNLKGSVEDRTTVITVTAEDDTTELVYAIIFEQEVLSINLQPFNAEPIISQMGFRKFGGNNHFEIYNPGNMDLDLSQYMVVNTRGEYPVSNFAEAITFNSDVYSKRFRRYVFGYEFVSEADWAAKPGYLVPDFGVNAILPPGETFVIAFYQQGRISNATWWATECDLIFDKCTFNMTTIEGLTAKLIPVAPLAECMLNPGGGTYNDPVFVFKIMNDSIFEGKKGITDPADFLPVEVLGDFTGAAWDVDGESPVIFQRQGIWRKPQYWKPDTILNASFGPTPDSSQWIYIDRPMLEALGYVAPLRDVLCVEGIGSHQINLVTVYKSTVNSLEYIASDGYVSPQTIIGVTTNTTVETFNGNIIKADAGQVLTVISGSDGAELLVDAIISDQDTLVVVSADGENTTKYTLTVSEGGLDDDAVLTAKDGSGYTIDISGSDGTITGIPFGASIMEVLANVTKPGKAVLNVIDEDDNLVPLYTTNFDTVEVETQASHLILFEVVAQNNSTIITYQLVLDVDASDALLFSDMYMVDQDVKLVSMIPLGTRVEALFTHLMASKGATVILIDKAGNERTLGDVAYDDMVVVTSEDGSTVNTYYLHFLEEVEGKDAYVLSSVLLIDQLELVIKDVEKNTPVGDLLAMLTPAPGAIMMVVDADGNEVTSGNAEEGYQVKVTSADGSAVVFYDITFPVSVGLNRDLEGIRVYPNPTEGEMFVVGLRENCLVSVLNITGEVVKVFRSNDIPGGIISISDQPAGLYFVTVKSDNYHLKSIRVVKQ